MSEEQYYETTLLNREDNYNETTLLSAEDEYGETTLLSAGEDYNETTLLSAGEDYNETTLLSAGEDYNETTLLSTEEDYNETTLLSTEEDYNETTLLSTEEDYNETTLLSAEEDYNGTTLLYGKKLIPPEVRMSKLQNIITGEEIAITKTPFTVGSETGAVDYSIHNPTVSRHHMDIIVIDTDYYIVDKNSTNGTTVDGVSISPENPMKLYNGALIQASEELFQFNISGGTT